MNNSEEQVKQPAPQLLGTELRVLGVLMEKQLTTPDQYPLTLNSVITACNQKSSRDPITNLTQGEVARVLQELDTRHFVRKERSSRSDKFTQQFMNHLELGRKQQALLCVMMLRGPQSLSELNTRTQRMCDFTDKEDLEHTVDRLCTREIPYVVRLPQQAGQRGERFTHLFSATSTQAGASALIATGAPVVKEQSAHTGSTMVESAGIDSQLIGSQPIDSQPINSTTTTGATHKVHVNIEQHIARLSTQVKTLAAETSELKQQLQQLYELTGNTPAATGED